MNISQSYIDILRAAHLIFFAAGMGTAVYFDFRSVMSLKKPVTQTDIKDLERIHTWISSAFLGLWVTGMALIYIRTAFDVSAFSPKLWLKVGLMVFMIIVARMIGSLVLPLMQKNLNQPLTKLPASKLSIASQVGITSMFCGTSGLALGSSVVLKTASWDLLLPLTLGWFVALTLGGQIAVNLIRSDAQKSPNPEQGAQSS
jgi:hypothetical protein